MKTLAQNLKGGLGGNLIIDTSSFSESHSFHNIDKTTQYSKTILVYLRSLKFSGLYSYDSRKKHNVNLSMLNVIIGPNDSGKSNLFRVIRLIGETLSAGNQSLDESAVHSNSLPNLEVRLVLGREEVDLLLDFLSLYRTNPGGGEVMRVHQLKNREELHGLVRHVTLAIRWRIGTYLPFEASVRVTFEDLELTVDVPYMFGPAQVVHEVSTKVNRSELLTELPQFLDSIAKDENPRAAVERKFSKTSDGLRKYFSINDIQGQLGQEASDDEKRALRRLMSFAGLQAGFGSLSFTGFFGKLVTSKLFLSTGGSIFYRRTMEFSKPSQAPVNQDENSARIVVGVGDSLHYPMSLEPDGWNLAQFLFRLKMSESFAERKRFGVIRGKFADLFEDLSFDIALHYGTADASRPPDLGGILIPQFPHVVITNEKKSIQFTLDKVGAGLAESLFLLTATSGLEDSVLFLDEPAVNLHPSHMKALAKILADSQSQLVIITHSPELVHQEIFELEANVIYVRRVEESSTVKCVEDSQMRLAIRDEELYKLSYQIDSRIFFANHVILCEGEADKEVLEIAAAHFGAELDTNQDIVLDVKSNGNFRKYVRLLLFFNIPFVILGDTDGLDGARLKKRATSYIGSERRYGLITKESLQNGAANRRLFFISGNLENLLISVDPALYSECEEKVERREGAVKKPLVAHEFASRILQKNPTALDSSVKPFLEIALQRPLRNGAT